MTPRRNFDLSILDEAETAALNTRPSSPSPRRNFDLRILDEAETTATDNSTWVTTTPPQNAPTLFENNGIMGRDTGRSLLGNVGTGLYEGVANIPSAVASIPFTAAESIGNLVTGKNPFNPFLGVDSNADEQTQENQQTTGLINFGGAGAGALAGSRLGPWGTLGGAVLGATGSNAVTNALGLTNDNLAESFGSNLAGEMFGQFSQVGAGKLKGSFEGLGTRVSDALRIKSNALKGKGYSPLEMAGLGAGALAGGYLGGTVGGVVGGVLGKISGGVFDNGSRVADNIKQRFADAGLPVDRITPSVVNDLSVLVGEQNFLLENVERYKAEFGIDITNPATRNVVFEAKNILNKVNADINASIGAGVGTSASAAGMVSPGNIEKQRAFGTFSAEYRITDGINLDPTKPFYDYARDIETNFEKVRNNIKNAKEELKTGRKAIIDDVSAKLGDNVYIDTRDVDFNKELRNVFDITEGIQLDLDKIEPDYGAKGRAERANYESTLEQAERKNVLAKSTTEVRAILSNLADKTTNGGKFDLHDTRNFISSIDEQITALAGYNDDIKGATFKGHHKALEEVIQKTAAYNQVRKMLVSKFNEKLDLVDPSKMLSQQFAELGQEIKTAINFEQGLESFQSTLNSGNAIESSKNRLTNIATSGELSFQGQAKNLVDAVTGSDDGRYNSNNIDPKRKFLEKLIEGVKALDGDAQAGANIKARSEIGKLAAMTGKPIGELVNFLSPRIVAQGVKPGQEVSGVDIGLEGLGNILSVSEANAESFGQGQQPQQTQQPLNEIITEEFLPVAQRPQFENGLPRTSNQFDMRASAQLLATTANRPEGVLLQGLVKKWAQASQQGDKDQISRLVSDMAKIAPDVFEAGQGVDGKLYHQDEQGQYIKKLEAGMLEGSVDSKMIASQILSFLNPNNSKILEIKPAMRKSVIPQKKGVPYEY